MSNPNNYSIVLHKPPKTQPSLRVNWEYSLINGEAPNTRFPYYYQEKDQVGSFVEPNEWRKDESPGSSTGTSSTPAVNPSPTATPEKTQPSNAAPLTTPSSASGGPETISWDEISGVAQTYRKQMLASELTYTREWRDDILRVQEGRYKSWEEADGTYFSEPGTIAKDLQRIPEIDANKSLVVVQTPSASVYFRKKYFRLLTSAAAWSPAFQSAVTDLMIQKTVDISTIEALTKYRYMYGVSETDAEGTLTKIAKNHGTEAPQSKEYNHYRAYWYGKQVTGIDVGGVLEVTNFSSLTTNLSIDTGDAGSCSITLEDPYNLLYVSKKDIDNLFDYTKDLNRQDSKTRQDRVDLEKKLTDAQAALTIANQKRDKAVHDLAAVSPTTEPSGSVTAAAPDSDQVLTQLVKSIQVKINDSRRGGGIQSVWPNESIPFNTDISLTEEDMIAISKALISEDENAIMPKDKLDNWWRQQLSTIYDDQVVNHQEWRSNISKVRVSTIVGDHRLSYLLNNVEPTWSNLVALYYSLQSDVFSTALSTNQCEQITSVPLMQDMWHSWGNKVMQDAGSSAYFLDLGVSTNDCTSTCGAAIKAIDRFMALATAMSLVYSMALDVLDAAPPGDSTEPSPPEKEKNPLDIINDEVANAEISVVDAQKALDNFDSGQIEQRPIAKLKSGATFTRKSEIDNLYKFLVGRSVFTVMDEIYVWMSPEKENLMDFNLLQELYDRYKLLQSKIKDGVQEKLQEDIDALKQAKADELKKTEEPKPVETQAQVQDCQSLIKELVAQGIAVIQSLRPLSSPMWNPSATDLDPAQLFSTESIAQLKSLCTYDVAMGHVDAFLKNYTIGNRNLAPETILTMNSDMDVFIPFPANWDTLMFKYSGYFLYNLTKGSSQRWMVYAENSTSPFVGVSFDSPNLSTSQLAELATYTTAYLNWRSQIIIAQTGKSKIHSVINIKSILNGIISIMQIVLPPIHDGHQQPLYLPTDTLRFVGNNRGSCWYKDNFWDTLGLFNYNQSNAQCAENNSVTYDADTSAVVSEALWLLKDYLSSLNQSSSDNFMSSQDATAKEETTSVQTSDPAIAGQVEADVSAEANSNKQMSEYLAANQATQEYDNQITAYTEQLNQLNDYKTEMADIETRFKAFGLSPTTIPKDLSQFMVFALSGGMQVFSGVVTRVSEAYNDGVHTVNINASSVMRFLEMTRFINSPSVTNFGGYLYDPIDVEVKVETDETVTPTGHFSWRHGQYFVAGNANSMAIFTSAYDRATALESMTSDYVKRVGLAFEKAPLQSLDSANIISVITTGLAFNPQLSMKASIPDSNHSFRRYLDTKIAQSPIPDKWINLLQIAANAQNKAFGDFTPFGWIPADISLYDPKTFKDEQYIHQVIMFDSAEDSTPLPSPQGVPRTEALKENEKFRALINGAIFPGQTLSEQIVLSTYGQVGKYRNIVATGKRSTSLAWADMKITGAQIDEELDQLKILELSNIHKDDITEFRVDSVIGGYPSVDAPDDDALLKCINYRDAQLAVLQNKRSDVVMNIDQNFVIIDMTYMASIAVRAFNFQVNQNMELWDTDRLNPKQICEDVVEQLDWEFFPDAQGNLWYRKPQYNRVPLSVFKEKILPYVLSFLKNSPDFAEAGSWADWERQIGTDAASQRLLKYLPGIDKSWVRAYQYKYLLAHLVEVDYPISEEGVAKEIFGDSILPSSSARSHYYIKDKNILSWSFDESEPKFCRLNVLGKYDGLTDTPGIPVYLTAAGVDFDLWYHYGFREEKVQKAFITNAQSQGMPYVSAYLTRQYSALLSGSIQIIGNPFYQTGEVIYVESRNMLFYVTKVAHNFSYSGQFTTTLSLGYGHYPGVWIPNPYDQTAALLSHDTRFLTSYDVSNFTKLLEFKRDKIKNATSDPSSNTHSVEWNEICGLNCDKENIIKATWDPSIVDRLRASLYYDRAEHELKLVSELRSATQSPGLTEG